MKQIAFWHRAQRVSNVTQKRLPEFRRFEDVVRSTARLAEHAGENVYDHEIHVRLLGRIWHTAMSNTDSIVAAKLRKRRFLRGFFRTDLPHGGRIEDS